MGEASEGRFEIDAVDGWLVGMPTCVLAGELATCEALAGELARPEFPAALRESATRRWRDMAARVLAIAESLASRGDVAGCAGLLAKAAVAIETIRQWRKRFAAPSIGKTLLKLQLLPRWLTSADFRLACTSGVSANSVCFERELLDHYRLVFEKTR